MTRGASPDLALGAGNLLAIICAWDWPPVIPGDFLAIWWTGQPLEGLTVNPLSLGV